MLCFVQEASPKAKLLAPARDKALARWCALLPEKSSQGIELSCAVLGGCTGSRLRLRCGLVLLLQGDRTLSLDHLIIILVTILFIAYLILFTL